MVAIQGKKKFGLSGSKFIVTEKLIMTIWDVSKE